MNRLRLDFSINTTHDRNLFLEQYLQHEEFLKKPLTPEECEICGNYILWGKDPISGKNVVQDKSIQISTKYKTWDAHQDESLEGLLENPGFTETMIQPSDTPPLKVVRENFSRAKARKNAPQPVLQQLEALWSEIDELDLLLNFYDIARGKRKIPPRAFLLEKFPEEKQLELQRKAFALTQFKYLKLRHLIVELRREQFSLRDSYSPTILSTKVNHITEQSVLTLDSDLVCAPLGLIYTDLTISKLFPNGRFPKPDDFTQEELITISNFLKQRAQPTQKMFDFANKDHIYQVFCLLDEFRDEATKQTLFSTSSQFLTTLLYYIDLSRLSDIHKEILHLKLSHEKNQQIANQVNAKYNKTYTANYISTIFKQKIIPQICATVRHHLLVTQNLFFPENFKQCKKCKQTLLIGTDNFIRKTRASDGFSSQCKHCDKKIRMAKYEL